MGERALSRDTSTGGEESSVASLVAGSRVDANGDPGEDAVGDVVVVEEDVLEDGVVVVLALEAKDAVGRVEGDLDVAGVVGVGGLDLGDEVLVVEELANVRDVAAGQGAVLEQAGADVGDDVDVGGAARVVTGEEGAERGHAVLVGGLDAAGKGLVQVGGVVAVAVAVVLDARVDTGRVAVPDVPPESLNGLARVDVDELGVQVVDHTGLLVDNVLAVELSLDPERSNLALGGQNAGVVGAEEVGVGAVDGDAGQVGVVSRVGDGSSIAGLEG
jgi:hypothetical protein